MTPFTPPSPGACAALALMLFPVCAPPLSAQAPPPPADEVVDAIAVRPGFRVELAAAEPLVADPVAAAFDENGRLFVIEYPQYNENWAENEAPRRGRVRLLVDEDGDGVFDRATTYIDELDNPMALACWDGGLYVGAAPDIWYFRDRDGDGVAEEKRKVFTGFGQETQRAGYAQLNSFLWGLDNRFHACSNYSGGEVRPAGDDGGDGGESGSGDAGNETLSLRRRGFVFDPRDEAGSYDAESGGGQHGMSFDDWGHLFTCQNSHPVQMYFYDERRMRGNETHQAPPALQNILATGKHTELFRISPDEEWRVVRTRRRAAGEFQGSTEGGAVSGFFTAATGVAIYRGDAWPERYRGSTLVGEPSNNLVFRAELAPDGVGFRAERGAEEAELGVEFIASEDNRFRPVQFVHAPDGNLLLLDMHRELIEGAGFLPPDVVEEMDVLGGSGQGRIFRIVHEENAGRRETPTLGERDSAELVELLAHPNVWHRETASRLLYQRQDKGAVDDLRTAVAESGSDLARVHAAWLLRGFGEIGDAEILRLLEDPRAEVRRHGVLLAGERAGASEEIAEALVDRLPDESKPVRHAASMELENLGDADRRARAVAQVLRRDGGDPWMRAAALSSLRGEAARVAEILSADPGAIGKGEGVGDKEGAAAAKDVMQALAAQVGQQQPLGNDSAAALLAAVENLASADPGLARATIASLLGTRQAAVLVEKIRGAGGRGSRLLESLLATARRVAFSTDHTAEQRANAIGRLRLLGEDAYRAFADDLLGSAQPGAVQASAIDGLGRFSSAEVAGKILGKWKGLAPAARERALGVLTSRSAWAGTLLDAVESGQVTRADLGATRVAALSAHRDGDIRERAGEVFAAAGFAAREKVVEEYRPALAMEGDAESGKEVFAATCAACHRTGGVGRAIGAELQGIMNRGPEAVLLNILDPNREVHADFLLYSVELGDGTTETGMIQSETASSLRLRRIDGSETELLRVDVTEVTSLGTSFMPEGLETAISVEQMADLLEFLKTAE